MERDGPIVPERRSNKIRIRLLIVALALCSHIDAEPQLSVMFPFGGPRGAFFEVEIGGGGFHDVTEVLFDCPGLSATTRTVEIEKDKPPRFFMTVDAQPDAPIGWHRFRLLAKHGLSRPWQIFITDEPTIVETPQAEGKPQRIEAPCCVYGKVHEPGDTDYYAFDVAANEQLFFELQTTSGLFADGQNVFQSPELLILKTGGSWFDPTRSTIVRCEDHSQYHFHPEREMNTAHLSPRLTHRFDEAGTYLVRVTEAQGIGSDLHSYQVRVRRESGSWSRRRFLRPDPFHWREHEFHLPIDSGHLTAIWGRTAREPEGGREALKVNELSEIERGEDFDGTTPIELPVFILGAIDRPGDSDDFPLSVEAGTAVAFEIRALKTERPYFSPRLVVEDTEGKEVVNNIYRKIAGDGDDWIKSIEAKVLYTFENGGDYVLRVRDSTSRQGGPEFEYRVFVRKQVPHVGDVLVKLDRVNLRPGGSVRMDVDVHREEGFKDVLAIDVLDLPEGFQILPADRVLPETGPPFPAVEKERFVATMHSLSVLLVVRDDAPLTPRPRMARVVVKPLLDGKPGPPIVIKELPVMVIP